MALTPRADIYHPTGDNNYSLVSDMAALAESVDTALTVTNRVIHPVANTADRDDAVSTLGIGNISAAQPLFVWRGDAVDGFQLEYTVDGVTWGSVPTSWQTSPQQVLYGDYTSVDAWRLLKTGTYVQWAGSITAGVPSTYGFIEVTRRGNDGSAMFYPQVTPQAFRFSWNQNTTAVEWSGLSTVRGTLGLASGITDFNTTVVNSVYHFHANAEMTSIANTPVNLAGMLETISLPRQDFATTAYGFEFQRYTVYNAGVANPDSNNVWVRGKYNNTWSAWSCIGGSDTGWVNCSYASGYNNTTAGQLQVRRKGTTVEIRGGAFGTYNSGVYHTVGTIPAGYRPSGTVRCGAFGQAGHGCAMQLNNNGAIIFSWHNNSVPSALSPQWIAGQTQYWTD